MTDNASEEQISRRQKEIHLLWILGNTYAIIGLCIVSILQAINLLQTHSWLSIQGIVTDICLWFLCWNENILLANAISKKKNLPTIYIVIRDLFLLAAMSLLIMSYKY